MTRNAPAWIGLTILAATGTYLVVGELIGLPTATAPDNLARLASGIALLVVIGGSAMVGFRGDVSLALKYALMWLAVGLGLVVVYTYRADFERLGQRVLSQLVPGVAIEAQAQGESGKVVAVTASRGGYFGVEGLVNDTNVSFLADTGATLVALSHDDAIRVGIDPDLLRYVVPVQTANGTVKNALVNLASIRVGNIEIENVRALVAQPEQLDRSLLGMSFLSQLSSFQIRGDQLILSD